MGADKTVHIKDNQHSIFKLCLQSGRAERVSHEKGGYKINLYNLYWKWEERLSSVHFNTNKKRLELKVTKTQRSEVLILESTE